MLRKRPPSHLKRAGRELWRDIAEQFAIDDAGGQALLTLAAECLDRLREAQAVVERDGPTTLDRYGQVRTHPALSLEKDARGQLLQALKQLNLDLEPLRDMPSAAGITWGK